MIKKEQFAGHERYSIGGLRNRAGFRSHCTGKRRFLPRCDATATTGRSSQRQLWLRLRSVEIIETAVINARP
jgi:hypothetical protein